MAEQISSLIFSYIKIENINYLDYTLLYFHNSRITSW